jgi:hypothetical protein
MHAGGSRTCSTACWTAASLASGGKVFVVVHELWTIKVVGTQSMTVPFIAHGLAPEGGVGMFRMSFSQETDLIESYYEIMAYTGKWHVWEVPLQC